MIGGLAVTIDWSQPIDRRRHQAMVDLIAHRGANHTYAEDHAVLSESRRTPDDPRSWAIATLDNLVIVGDIVLWNTDGLRTRAGGLSVTEGLEDRNLILAAYRRNGLDFVDVLYGEFSFIIWDSTACQVIACRDHLGARPLFIERTRTEIRLATEAKQLVATSTRSPEPNPAMVAERLTGRSRDSTQSMFLGIDRLPPSHVLIASAKGERISRYWNPGDDSLPPPPPSDVAATFREHLVDSVRRRVDSSTGVVSQLSGGLDSGSVTASAHILATEGRLFSPVHTATVLFPGYPSVDESRWVDEVVDLQPFDHHTVQPGVVPLDVFADDMWITDTPDANPIRVMWAGMGPIARGAAADTVITGMGGDEINDQDQLLIDKLRYGPLRDRYRVLQSLRSWSVRSVAEVFLGEARAAMPGSIRRLGRRVVPAKPPAWDLRSHDLAVATPPQPEYLAGLTQEFARAAQFGVVAMSQGALLTRMMELEHIRYASLGVAVTHPYVDRLLIEYLASLPIEARPFDGRSKTMVRRGYAGWLPSSVLTRRTKTVADSFLDGEFPTYLSLFGTRFPVIPEVAQQFIDGGTYSQLMSRAHAMPIDPTVRTLLWRAWEVMLWLEHLDRYRN